MTDTTPAPATEDAATIQHWFASMESFWETPLSDGEKTDRRLALARFAESTGVDPDAMIADVLSGEDGSVAMPRVAAYWKLIRAFGEAETKGASLLVMSFFIHNGVLMQAPLDA